MMEEFPLVFGLLAVTEMLGHAATLELGCANMAIGGLIFLTVILFKTKGSAITVGVAAEVDITASAIAMA